MFRLEEATEINTKNIRIVRSSLILGQFFRPSRVSNVAKRWTKQTKRSRSMQKTSKMVSCWWDLRAGYTNDVNCIVLQKRSLALLEAISDESIHRFANSESPNMKAFRWFSRKHETRFCTAGRSRKRTKKWFYTFSSFLCFCVVFKKNWPTRRTEVVLDGDFFVYTGRLNSVSSMFSSFHFSVLRVTSDTNRSKTHPKIGPHRDL